PSGTRSSMSYRQSKGAGLGRTGTPVQSAPCNDTTGKAVGTMAKKGYFRLVTGPTGAAPTLASDEYDVVRAAGRRHRGRAAAVAFGPAAASTPTGAVLARRRRPRRHGNLRRGVAGSAGRLLLRAGGPAGGAPPRQ